MPSVDDKKKFGFSDFKLRVERHVPHNRDSYSRYYKHNKVNSGFTLEETIEIIESGDLKLLRELSRYYYRTNGLYRNNVDFLSTLLKFDTMVTPNYDVTKKISKTKVLDSFYKACHFVDILNIPINFTHINREILMNGVYYGILREEENKYTIQDLPIDCCRSRFKDFNSLNILEFNLQYFMRIADEQARLEAVLSFPKVVQKAYAAWRNNKRQDEWVEIPVKDGGICFFDGDKTPLLIASIPSLHKMTEAIDREGMRDEKELYKLLIQKMPIDNKGELVFELEEVADIHESVAEMLSDMDTVDVLTTFGDTSLESLQDSTAAAQSTNRIEKYKTAAFDALGRSALIFNAEGSSALAYSIQRDEALMMSFARIYANWIRVKINELFARSNLSFDFDILPTTVFNQDKIQKQSFQGAQYGYSKMYAGVALGIKQVNQISLMNFENDLLKMHEKMIPLQSSYTSSNSDIKNKTSEEKEVKEAEVEDINNEGGRPELDDTQKSEKTEQNIESIG